MEYQERIVDGHRVIFSADWITELESEEHFSYYWSQAQLVFNGVGRDEKILELGCGTKLLSDLLRRRGFDVSTLDIDEAKQPDYCSDASTFDYSVEAFTSLLAFEIFEHIPWQTFEKVLGRISSSAISRVIFSVPWAVTSYKPIRLHIPRVGVVAPEIRLPRRSITTPAHFWELRSARGQRRNPDVDFRTPAQLEHAFTSRGWRLETLSRRNYIQFFEATR